MTNVMPEGQRLLRLLEHALALPEPERRAYLQANAEAGQLDQLLAMLGQAEGGTAALPEGLFRGSWNAHIDRTGQQFGIYRIDALIGEGGMGQVYLAQRTDGLLEQRVAIKVIRHLALTSSAVRQFHNERQILADLSHSNIARLIDAGSAADGSPYVVMEFVDGVPLNEYLAEYQPDFQARLQLFLSIASGVAAAHQNLVIHRDLKPSNVLVTKDGTPKLLDFGIAKYFDQSERPGDQTVSMLMTPSYASPEQIRGDPVNVTTDVYSLGLLLFECLTDRRLQPFSSLSLAEIDRQLTERAPLRPSRRVAGEDPGLARRLSGDLDAVIGMATALEPGRRYPSVEALCTDVERVRRREPVSAQPDSAAYRLRKFVARHRPGVAASLVALVGLLGALLVSLQQTRIANEQLARAETVSRFMGDVLLSPASQWDLRFAAGPDAKISDVLDLAGERILTDLKEYPSTQLELLTDVSSALARLSRYGPALRYSSAAEGLVSSHDDLPANLVLRFLVAHSFNLSYLDRESESLEVLQRARLLAQSTGLDATMQYIYVLNNLSGVHALDGRYPEAIALLEEAIELFKTLNDDQHHPAFATGYSNLGGYVGQTGDLARARRLFDAATEIVEQPVHRNEAIRGYLYPNRALLEAVELNFDEAIALADIGVLEAGRLIGQESLVYAQAIARRGFVSALAGDLETAVLWAGRARAVNPAFDLSEVAFVIARAAIARNDLAAISEVLEVDQPADIPDFQTAVWLFEQGVGLWRKQAQDRGLALMRRAFGWTDERFSGVFNCYYFGRLAEENIDAALIDGKPKPNCRSYEPPGVPGARG